MSQQALMYNFRGEYGKELTNEVAYYAGLVTGEYYKRRLSGQKPAIFVGKDHRFSSDILKHFAILGLVEGGCAVRDVGCLPTSIVSFITNREGDGACVVTASHNPPTFNGLKFFEADGSVLKPEVEDKISEKVITSCSGEWSVPSFSLGYAYSMVSPTDILERYVSEACAGLECSERLRVAVDCRFGTATLAIPLLLERLDFPYALMNAELNPYFQHPGGEYIEPEPRQDNIQNLCDFVTDGGYDLGLAFDGDSDRSVIVDEAGFYVEDDLVLLMLCFECAQPGDTLALTMDISLMVERELERQGYNLVLTAVGDPFVTEKLQTSGGVFGGVPNGHYVFPHFNFYSDGIYASAILMQFVSRLRKQGSSLHTFLQSLPKSFIIKRKLPYKKGLKDFERDVAPRLRDFLEARCETVDYRQTDETVMMGKGATYKLLTRYNRWDHNFNVQAESLKSKEAAQNYFELLSSVLRTVR